MDQVDRFWREFWNEKAKSQTDFEATGRSRMDIVGFLHTVSEIKRHLALDRSHVLADVGCGSGIVALALAPWVSRVHAIDISSLMVERAQLNLEGIANVDVRVGSITETNLAPKSVDRFVAYSVLQYLSNEDALKAAFVEIRNVLSVGGIALLAANPDPARRGDYERRLSMDGDAAVKARDLSVVARTKWFAPERVVQIAEAAGLLPRVKPISSRIWQCFYMYDLVVTRGD